MVLKYNEQTLLQAQLKHINYSSDSYFISDARVCFLKYNVNSKGLTVMKRKTWPELKTHFSLQSQEQ